MDNDSNQRKILGRINLNNSSKEPGLRAIINNDDVVPYELRQSGFQHGDACHINSGDMPDNKITTQNDLKIDKLENNISSSKTKDDDIFR